MKNRPFFLLSSLSMVGALFAVIAMSLVNDKADLKPPAGFASPILALEFAQTNATINALFDRTKSDTLVRYDPSDIYFKAQFMDTSTNLDYLFILAYGSFMLFFALQCKRIGENQYWLAITFALLAAIADVMENGLLKEIFGLVADLKTDFSMYFSPLHFWTCLKFFSTGAYFLALAPFFWKANWLGKLVVLSATVSIIFWALASFWKPEYYADALFGMIFLAFLGAMIFGLTYKVKGVAD